MRTKLLNYWKQIDQKLPRKRAAKVQLVMFGVITLMAVSIAPVVVLINRSDVDIRQQAYTDPATGESCGWCAGPDQCFASTGRAPEAGSSAACAGGACCTGFSAGGGGGNTGGGGGGGATTPATAKGVGANCVLGGSADPPAGCDGAGPLICASCPGVTNKAGQAVCSFTEDGGSQHIAACGGLKGQTATGPAVCTVGQRSQCGVDGCIGNQQRLCDAFGQWGPCVNSTQCGYTGANNGVACSQDIHCKSGFCNPTSKTCSDPQPNCYKASDNCGSYNQANCSDAQSFTSLSACSVAVAPGCYVVSDQCQSDNPQNCESSGAFQSQVDCQAALEAGQGGITPRCYVESNGCSNLTLANCQANDSHTSYEACAAAILPSGGGTSVPTLSSCSLSCGNASGCQCPSGCQRTFAQVGQSCGSTATSGGGVTVPTLGSCSQTCTGANGCNCPTSCVNNFVQVGQQCGTPVVAPTQPTQPTEPTEAPSGGGRETSLIPSGSTPTPTPTPVPTPVTTSTPTSTPTPIQLAQNLGQAGGSQPTIQPTATPRITIGPTSGLGLTVAPSLPPSQTATPIQTEPTTGGTSLGNLLQPTTSPTSRLQALFSDQASSAINQIFGPANQPTPRPSVQPLQAGGTATPVEPDEPVEVTVPERPAQPQNPLLRAIAAVTQTTTTTVTSPINQARDLLASSGLGRFLGVTPASQSPAGDQTSATIATTSNPELQLQTDIFDLEFQIYAQREECLAEMALDQFRDPQLRRFCEPEDLKTELSQRIDSDPLCQQTPAACDQVRDELQSRARAAYITQANEAQASYLTRSCGAGGDDPTAIDFNCIKQVEDEVVALENEITAVMDEYCQDKEDEAACQDIRTEITDAVVVRVQETIDFENTQEELFNAAAGEENIKTAIKNCETQLKLGAITLAQYQACEEEWTLDSRIDNVQAVIDQARTGDCYNQDICESEAKLIATVETKLEELDDVLEFNAQLVINEQTLQSALIEMQTLGCYRDPAQDRCVELQVIISNARINIYNAESDAEVCGQEPSTGGLQASIDNNPYHDLSDASCVDLVSYSHNKSGTVDELINVYTYESEIDLAADRWLQAETFINLNCFREEVVNQAACDQAAAELADAKAAFLTLADDLDDCQDSNTDNSIDSCQHLRDLRSRINTQLDETSVALNEMSSQIAGHVDGRFVFDNMIDAAVNYNSRSFYCVTSDYCLVVEPDGSGGYTSRALTFNALVAEYNISAIRQDQLLGQTAFTNATDQEFDPNNPSHVLAFGQVVYHQWYQDDTRSAEICYEQQRADAGTQLSCADFVAATGFFHAQGDDQYIKSCTSAGCSWVRVSSAGQRDDEAIIRRAAEILIFDQGYQGYDPTDHPSYDTWLDLQNDCETEFIYCAEADNLYREIQDQLIGDFLEEQSLTVSGASDILFNSDPTLTDQQKTVIGSYIDDFGGISYLGPQDDLADPNYLYDRVQFNINLGVRTDFVEQALASGCNDSGHVYDEEAGIIYVNQGGSNILTCTAGVVLATGSLLSETGLSGATSVTHDIVQTRGYFDQSIEAFGEGDIAAGTERGLQGVYSGLNTARPVIALAGGPFGMIAAIADYDYAGAQTAALFSDEGSLGDRLLAGVKTVGSLTGGVARPVDTFFYNTQTGQTLGAVLNFGFNTVTGDEEAAADSLFQVVEHGVNIDTADILLSGGLGLQTGIQGLSAIGLPNQVVRQGASRVFVQEFIVEENLENVTANVVGGIGRQYDLAQGSLCTGGDVCFSQVGELFGNLFGGLIGGDIEQISNIDFADGSAFSVQSNTAFDLSTTNPASSFVGGQGSSGFLANNQTVGTNTVFSPILQVDGDSVTIHNLPIAVNSVAFEGSDTRLVTNRSTGGNTSAGSGGVISGTAQSIANARTTTPPTSITAAQSILQTAVANANAIVNQLFGGNQLSPAAVGVTQVANLNQTQRLGGFQDINNQTSFIDLDVLNPDSPRFDPGATGTVLTRASVDEVANITQPGSTRVGGNLNFPNDILTEREYSAQEIADLQEAAKTNLITASPEVVRTVAESLASNTRVRSAIDINEYLMNQLDKEQGIDDSSTYLTNQQIAQVTELELQRQAQQNTTATDLDTNQTVVLDLAAIRAQAAQINNNPTTDLNTIAQNSAATVNSSNTPVDTRTTTQTVPNVADTQVTTPDDATNPLADEDTNPFVEDQATEPVSDQSSTTQLSSDTQPLVDTTAADVITTQPTRVTTSTDPITQREFRERINKILADQGTNTQISLETTSETVAQTTQPAVEPDVDQTILTPPSELLALRQELPDAGSGGISPDQTTDISDADIADTDAPTQEIATQNLEQTLLTPPVPESQSQTETSLDLEDETGPLTLTLEDRNLALEQSQSKRPVGLDQAIARSQAATQLNAPTELSAQLAEEVTTEELQETEPTPITTPSSFIGRAFNPRYLLQNMRTLGEAHGKATELARINSGNINPSLVTRVITVPVRVISNMTLHLYAAFSGLSAEELAQTFWSIELNNGANKSSRTANTELTSGKGNYDNVRGMVFNIDGDFTQASNQAKIIAADTSAFFNTIIKKVMPRIDYNSFSSSQQITFAVVQADGNMHIYQISKQDVLSLSQDQLSAKVLDVLNGQPAAVISADAVALINQQLHSGSLHYGKPITARALTPGNAMTRFFRSSLVDQQGIDLLNQVQTMYNFNSQYILGKGINTPKVLPSAHHAVHVSAIVPGTTNTYNFSMQYNHPFVNGAAAKDDFFSGTTDVLVNEGVGQTQPEYYIENDPSSRTHAVRIRMNSDIFAQNKAKGDQIKAKAKELGLDLGRGFGRYDPIHRALIRAISKVTGEKYTGHFLSAIANNSEFISPAIVVIGDVNTETEALYASSQEKINSFEGNGLVSMYGAISQSIQNRAFFRWILNSIGKGTFGPQTNLITGGRIIMFSNPKYETDTGVGFSTAQSGSYGNGIVIGMIDNTASGGTIELRFDIGEDVSSEEAAAIKDFLENLDSEQFQQMIVDELALEEQALEIYKAQRTNQ